MMSLSALGEPFVDGSEFVFVPGSENADKLLIKNRKKQNAIRTLPSYGTIRRNREEDGDATKRVSDKSSRRERGAFTIECAGFLEEIIVAADVVFDFAVH
jgi:hypothetical protein